MVLRKAFMILVSLTLFAANIHSQDSDWKKGVTQKFDEEIDHFTSQDFERFEVFDQFKDLNGVAVDIGAWIGTSSIGLSKNFQHVVSVEFNRASLTYLTKNLEASECKNVSICNRPLAATSKPVIFETEEGGPVRPITLKQLLVDYVYANSTCESKEVSFIHCDVGGKEEDIIEDILYFCSYNRCAAYVSFHLDEWESHKIRDFEYLFRHFETNCPTGDLCAYLEANPFASILFKPIETEGLVKKNIPAVIIGYNLVSYVRNMVDQLKNYTSDIIVIDNNSTFAPLLEYYQDEFNYTLIKMNDNYGNSIYKHASIQRLLGDLYILTDPDLQFNSKLPPSFISDFIGISNYFRSGRVGFALSIDSDDIRTDIHCYHQSIKEWESQFWQAKLIYPLDELMELYVAPIDTTLCLVNKKYPDNIHIRVAGDYTCLHLPWHKNFRKIFLEGEYESYLQNNTSTNWFFE